MGCLDNMQSKNCECRECKGVYRVSYRPGSCEAVVQCQSCKSLYYSMIYERMGFGEEDVMEEYQIPITEDELERIKADSETLPDLAFLKGRKARTVWGKNSITLTTSDLALGRCGR